MTKRQNHTLSSYKTATLLNSFTQRFLLVFISHTFLTHPFLNINPSHLAILFKLKRFTKINTAMNSEKPVSPENLSDENDEEEAQDDSGGTKRSYECTFCKRGFTNAQALGGHMNIHRKDRARAKQFTLEASPSINKFNTDESIVFPFASQTLNQPARSNYSILESQRNCDRHFHPPPPASAFYYDFYDPRSRSLSFNQELRGANLSLQIGPSHHVGDDIHQVRGNQKDSEVDLELRLGHHP